MLRLMSEPRILVERRCATVLVTLNAPKRRNAIDQEMVDGLHGVLDEYWDDETVAACTRTPTSSRATR